MLKIKVATFRADISIAVGDIIAVGDVKLRVEGSCCLLG